MATDPLAETGRRVADGATRAGLHSKVCERARVKAELALDAQDLAAITPALGDLMQEGDDAAAAGQLAEATARYAEVLTMCEAGSKLRAPLPPPKGPARRPSSRVATAKQPFHSLVGACAYCGASAPQQLKWSFCSTCHKMRYCSDQCANHFSQTPSR